MNIDHDLNDLAIQIDMLTENDMEIEDFAIPASVDIERFRQEIVNANTTNWMVKDFLRKVLEIVPFMYHQEIREVAHENCFEHEILKDVLEDMESEAHQAP